jgi:ubiquinone/menaquinone biosynthesis C-methylase UbiE
MKIASAPGKAGIPLFDRIFWRDPVSGLPLEPIVTARTPAGVPICGALRVAGSSFGYPIVDCVARLTPELASRHRSWLSQLGLDPPVGSPDAPVSFQPEASVESFGWQWAWNSAMRSEDDLRMRVADRFGIDPKDFRGVTVLDAGAGAGDQSRFLLEHGAEVVSIDLSAAIEVVARKLRMRAEWVGVQGDITAMPFGSDQFDIGYCEGVIQHTRDSAGTVGELCRVVKVGGRILATHYVRLAAKTVYGRLKRKLTQGYFEFLRARLSRMERYKLQLLTGNLTALSYVPVLGYLLRRTGTAIHYGLMPDFKTTWTNTLDYYGGHEHQRYVTPEEFLGYFAHGKRMELIFKDVGVVVARKLGPAERAGLATG